LLDEEKIKITIKASQLFPSHLLGRIGLTDQWPVDPSIGMEQPKPAEHRRFSIVGRRRHCIAVLLPRCRPSGLWVGPPTPRAVRWPLP